MALGDILARLSVELGLNSAAFEQGAKRAGKQTNDLGDRMERLGTRVGKAGKAIAVAGAAVAGAFVLDKVKELVTSGLDYASALGEQAQQLGVSSKALQEYRYIATQTGISQEEMDKSLQRLTRSLGQAAGGAKGPSGAFQKLGIDVKGFIASGGDAGDLLPLIADGLAKLGSPAERAAVGAQLLGKNFQVLEPLLVGGSKAINGARAEAERLGVVLSEAQIQKADETADKINKLNFALNAKISGVVADNADSILALVEALTELISVAGRAGQEFKRFKISQGYFTEALKSNNPFASEAERAAAAAKARQFDTAGQNLNGKIVPFKFNGGGALRGGAGAVSPFLAKPGSKLTPGLGPLKSQFATGGDQFDAGRGIANLAALTGQAEATAGRLAPALEKVAAATAATQDEFSKLTPAAQALFDQLFPREAANREYELALAELRKELDKGVISLSRFEEAKRRLSAASVGLDADDEFTATAYDDVEPLVANLDLVESGLYRFKKSLATNADAAEVANVRVVTSFEDMAQATLASLNQVTSAVKGGGFLNILSSIIGLGLQLGSVGVFGKGFQTRINSPQLAPVTSGSSISPAKNNGLKVEVIANNNGFGAMVRNQAGQVVAQAAPAIMAGGAKVAQSNLTYRNTRRVG